MIKNAMQRLKSSKGNILTFLKPNKKALILNLNS